jgi:DSBA-like thioredoxin domain
LDSHCEVGQLLVAIAAVGGLLLGQSTRKPSQVGCASSQGCGIANDPWTIGTAGPENAPNGDDLLRFPVLLCGRTAHVLVDTLGESKDFRLIFKHLPKNDVAVLAHEAAIAAGAQGKFWEMHNMLFENQSHLSRADLSNYSRQLGLNVATFSAALDQHTYRNMIAHDLADAIALGVVTAPTFFINGRR